ncbi:MAG: glycoside hydrolase family 3 protein [Candidatus Ornithomonoglobus sp.]
MKISERTVNGVVLGDVEQTPVCGIEKVCADACAEGAVLLKNNGVLPLSKGSRVSVFGRMQNDYYKSGTGSGGLVHVPYKTNIYDELLKQEDISVNTALGGIYAQWVKEHPYDSGDGWVEPWCQEEMYVDAETAAKAAVFGNTAVVIIARTAGEDKDAANEPGSWLLTDAEREMLKNVRAAFDKVCVVLNTGNIIDMKWVEEYKIDAVLYVWQGGQEGGRAAAELLCGKRYPSGKLSDTIPFDIEEHPAFKNFGGCDENAYEEDIFVGYRYFETFAPDKVMYPFGYGMGYTAFELSGIKSCAEDGRIITEVTVTNTGAYAGKETVQIYYGSEGTALTRPSKALAAFAKTKELAPGESETLSVAFEINSMAAYDDTGATGNKSCYVLDKGIYRVYCGADSHSAVETLEYDNESDIITQRLSALFDVNNTLKRMINDNGRIAYETIEPEDKEYKAKHLKEIPYSGDKGIKLADVSNGAASMEDFVSQLSNYDLACLSQGEGINSSKTRPGCVGAIGGTTFSLRKFGIPVICLTDGPSGLRFDNGDEATLCPNGTLMACTWNPELARLLYSYEGMEIYSHDVDSLLGPGMNIHRFPLCGRNFEYFSEDPYLTGIMAGAMCEGMQQSGISGTIKHFATNNQEWRRHFVNTLCSERALREIYLKPFEMVIRGKKTKMVMTAYNKLNGTYCSASYDLNTRLLREEWGYDGLVMTDWWANSCVENGEVSQNRAKHISAQNDVFMVNADVEATAAKIMDRLHNGEITTAQLQRNAINILNTIMSTPTFERESL